MADYICAPPAERVIPVTRGCDRAFTIQRVSSTGTAVAFDAGSQVYMWIDVDRAAPTKVDAVVSGSTAAFSIQSTVLDLVRSSTRWRIVLDVGELEVPLLVGKFQRYDG
jgi:hypothetical protein